MNKTINILELASNLAHDRTLYESYDILNNEDEIYQDINAEELHYTEEIQDRFNEWYGYYLSEIDKAAVETNKDKIDLLIKSCQEGLDGTWDCSTDEGRESFQAMIDLLEQLK